MLPCFGREHYRLSVTDGCRWRGGDWNNLQHCIACLLVKIAHSRKFNKSGRRGAAEQHPGPSRDPPGRDNPEACSPGLACYAIAGTALWRFSGTLGDPLPQIVGS
jgi:hypothetical protein